MALQYVSDELRADISIVRAAFKASRGRALCFASKSAVLYVLASNANALKYTSEVMKNDPEIVMAAIRGGTSWQKGEALKFASPELRANKEVRERLPPPPPPPPFLLTPLQMLPSSFEFISISLLRT